MIHESKKLILLGNPDALHAQVYPCGTIRSLHYRDIQISLWPGTPWEPPVSGFFLRPRINRSPKTSYYLIGPGKICGLHTIISGPDSLQTSGSSQGLVWSAEFLVENSTSSFLWLADVLNSSNSPQEIDFLFLHGLALTDENGILLNEFYVSHYVDHFPFQTNVCGWTIASRQNLPAGGRNPWTLCSSLGKSVSFATDALQTHGLWPRSGQPPRFHNRDLPSIRHQAEHSLVALQSEVFRLPPGASAKFGICLLYCDHHPNPSSPEDFNLAAHARQLAYQKLATLTPPPSNTPELPTTTTQNQTLFTAPFFESEEPKFDDILVTYGENLRHLEKDQQGLILSFFTDDGRHIVSQRKEREVLRPHGHILRTNETWEPLESEVSATAWMAGIFAAQLAQGHPSANRLLSTALSYLALQRAAGIRIWVEENGQWLLLGIPTLWEISLTRCRWLYKKENIQIEISLQTNPNLSSLDFSANVTSGPPLRFLLAAHLALDDRNGRGSLNPSLQIHPNSIQIFPHPNSFVAKRFPNGFFEVETSSPELWEFRGPATPLAPNNPQTASEWPFLCLQSAPTLNLSLKFHGRLLSPISPQTNTQPFHSSIHNIIHIENRFQNPNFSDLQKFETITPWFAHNAAIHYLSPRGLEQYSGGGWGVRDVCQGAFEFLLALGKFDAAKATLRRVFQQQNPNGDWPQWFLLYQRDWNIRPPDSHGDIIYWPLLALAQWLISTEDFDFLEEKIHFFDSDSAPLLEHLQLALAEIRRRQIPGTLLPSYGNGDWNDAMQPAKPQLRTQLSSVWTAQLQLHTLRLLANAFGLSSLPHLTSLAQDLNSWANALEKQLHDLAIHNGICAGLLLFENSQKPLPLLHPDDNQTGITLSLLPLAHGILWEVFDPQTARSQMDVISQNLLAPDAARLFDRPPPYNGGQMRWFQRAESAAYFGREMGLAYFHAHLRFAEAAAHLGLPDVFYHALQRVVPIELSRILPNSRLRQSNTYFSSSDALFPDRPTAEKFYDKIFRGEVPLDGGWRIYSSGPGLFLSLLIRRFFGLTIRKNSLLLDPVLPKQFDGLQIHLHLQNFSFQLTYHIRSKGHSIEKILIENKQVNFQRQPNRYRPGLALLPLPYSHNLALDMFLN